MKNRSVIEIMVIVFTFIVAFALVGLGTMIIFIEVRNPEADTALLASSLMNLVTGIMGALLGIMVGKSEDLHDRGDGTKDDIE